jgi:hypothetical protein
MKIDQILAAIPLGQLQFLLNNEDQLIKGTLANIEATVAGHEGVQEA